MTIIQRGTSHGRRWLTIVSLVGVATLVAAATPSTVPPSPVADAAMRERLSVGASRHAAQYTWAATARGTPEVLAAEALVRRRRP